MQNQRKIQATKKGLHGWVMVAYKVTMQSLNILASFLVWHLTEILKIQNLRTPDHVMDEAGDLLRQKKPKMVYEELKEKYDEVERPASLQQLRD